MGRRMRWWHATWIYLSAHYAASYREYGNKFAPPLILQASDVATENASDRTYQSMTDPFKRDITCRRHQCFSTSCKIYSGSWSSRSPAGAERKRTPRPPDMSSRSKSLKDQQATLSFASN